MKRLERSRSFAIEDMLPHMEKMTVLPHLMPSAHLPEQQEGKIPKFGSLPHMVGNDHSKLNFFDSFLYSDVEGSLERSFVLLEKMLESGDDYQRMSAIEWINSMYMDSAVGNTWITARSRKMHRKLRRHKDLVEKRFGVFDGEKGYLFPLENFFDYFSIRGAFDLEDIFDDKKVAFYNTGDAFRTAYNDESFCDFITSQKSTLLKEDILALISKLSAYYKAIVRIPNVALKVHLDLMNGMQMSAASRRAFIISIDWNDEKIQRDLENDLREDVLNAVDEIMLTDEEKNESVVYRNPLKIVSSKDVVDMHPVSGLMMKAYQSSCEEGYFIGMNSIERFEVLCREIYPIKNVFRDQAFLEQLDYEQMSVDQLLQLRDNYSDIHLADEVSQVAYEKAQKIGKLDDLRMAFSESDQGIALMHAIGIDSLETSRAWQVCLYDILCFHPVPSYFRDELLEKLTNLVPQPGQNDRDIPGCDEDIQIIRRWYVERGALRNDKYSHQRISEMEFIFNTIRQMNRSERIDMLLVIMGIQLENETTRRIEKQLRRRLPGVGINSSRLTRRERENILLEIFEGDIHGVFTPASHIDPTKPDKLLEHISQHIVREGDADTRLRVSNLIFRILEQCHWTKRLQLTQDILDFSRNKTMTMPQMVKMFLCSLGAVFMKGAQQEGQQNWVPRDYREELVEINDNTPLLSKDKIMDVVKREIGLDHFRCIGEPIGSASIAQVHRAVLHDGREIALKVIRPGVVNQVHEELKLAEDLIRFVNSHHELFGVHIPESLITEIYQSLIPQLDLRLELENARNYDAAVDQQKTRLSVSDLNVVVVQAVEDDFFQSRRTAAYDYVRGVSLTKPQKIEQLADILGYTLDEVRQTIALALATVQIGTLVDGKHAQMDPNKGNALLTVSGLESVSKETRKCVFDAIGAIRAGSYTKDDIPVLTRREVRQLGLELQLLDFGHICEIPYLYRELLHETLWNVLTGNLEGLKNNFIEYHLSAYLKECEGNLSQIPVVDLKGLQNELLGYFEDEFTQTTVEILEGIENEEITKERFQMILSSLTQKHDFAKVFQDILEILDNNQVRIPSEVMGVLRQFRIGSYIFEDLKADDLMDFLKKITPRNTLEKLKGNLKSKIKKIVPKGVMSLIKKGVRSFAPLRKEIEKERKNTPWYQIMFDRLKKEELQTWFEKLKPNVRQYRIITDKMILEYEKILDKIEDAHTKPVLQIDSEYTLGVKKIALAHKLDVLPLGTVMQFYVQNKRKEFSPDQPEDAQVELSLVFLDDFNFNSKSPIRCRRPDGVIKKYGPHVLLQKSIVYYKGKWMKGVDLIMHAEPGKKITKGNIEGLSQVVPLEFNEYFETIEMRAEIPRQMCGDISKDPYVKERKRKERKPEQEQERTAYDVVIDSEDEDEEEDTYYGYGMNVDDDY